MNISDLSVVIENPKGTYKSFETEGDPVWQSYPLKGVTYPVDYGYIDGHTGEDGAELDVFVGTGDLSGFIKVWRLDVPEETKFFMRLTQSELDEVLSVLKPVLLTHSVLERDAFLRTIETFKNN